MAPAQFRSLKIGNNVARKSDAGLHGTVIRVTSDGLKIKWDDGKITDQNFDAMKNFRIVQ
jgi:preprotein translocase subunit YajC